MQGAIIQAYRWHGLRAGICTGVCRHHLPIDTAMRTEYAHATYVRLYVYVCVWVCLFSCKVRFTIPLIYGEERAPQTRHGSKHSFESLVIVEDVCANHQVIPPRPDLRLRLSCLWMHSTIPIVVGGGDFAVVRAGRAAGGGGVGNGSPSEWGDGALRRQGQPIQQAVEASIAEQIKTHIT